MVKILRVKCGLHPEIESIDDLPGGQEYVFSLGLKGKPHTIDLCDKCHEGTIKVLADAITGGVAELLPENSRLPQGKPASDSQHSIERLTHSAAVGIRRGRAAERNIPCLWCPLTYSGGSNGKTLPVRHFRLHGFENSVDAFGRTCPLCGVDMDQLGGHVVRKHPEVNSVPEAFIRAQELGDPYGAYEAVMSRGQNVLPRDS